MHFYLFIYFFRGENCCFILLPFSSMFLEGSILHGLLVKLVASPILYQVQWKKKSYPNPFKFNLYMKKCSYFGLLIKSSLNLVQSINKVLYFCECWMLDGCTSTETLSEMLFPGHFIMTTAFADWTYVPLCAWMRAGRAWHHCRPHQI